VPASSPNSRAFWRFVNITDSSRVSKTVSGCAAFHHSPAARHPKKKMKWQADATTRSAEEMS
jgi:hypothetical protein